MVAAGTQLIDPECEFDPFNEAVNGIGPVDVKGAPTWPQFWPQLKAMLDGSKVVAHFASFDLGCLRQSVARYALDGPRLEVACSWRLSKRASTWNRPPARKATDT